MWKCLMEKYKDDLINFLPKNRQIVGTVWCNEGHSAFVSRSLPSTKNLMLIIGTLKEVCTVRDPNTDSAQNAFHELANKLIGFVTTSRSREGFVSVKYTTESSSTELNLLVYVNMNH